MPWVETGPLRCWEWTGRTDDHGTPIIRTKDSSTTAARLYWQKEHGKPVPEGKILIALCGNSLCVRPLHRDPVTPSEFQYRVGNSKLDRRRAAMALLMRERGLSRRETARRVGVSARTVEAIEDGTHWTQRKEAA